MRAEWIFSSFNGSHASGLRATFHPLGNDSPKGVGLPSVTHRAPSESIDDALDDTMYEPPAGTKVTSRRTLPSAESKS